MKKKLQIQIPKNVIVELVLEDMDFHRDAKLPTQMLIGDLRKGLIVLLREKEPKRFSKLKEITISFQGNLLPDSTTLAAVGAWDGSVLDLHPFIRRGPRDLDYRR